MVQAALVWTRAHGCRVGRDRGKTQPSLPSPPFCEAQVSCGNLLHLGRSLLARGYSRPQRLPCVPGVESSADHQVAACLCAQAPDGTITCPSEVPNCRIFISINVTISLERWQSALENEMTPSWRLTLVRRPTDYFYITTPRHCQID